MNNPAQTPDISVAVFGMTGERPFGTLSPLKSG
jgi:hypothetical protein